MNKFNAHILKWKFKKIAVTYIIAAIIAVIGCISAVAVVFKDNISFAWQYSRLAEAEESSDTAAVQNKIKELASASSDIVDIIMLDDDNNITYSANNSEFAQGKLDLAKSSGNYLVSDKYEDIVFKYVRGDEFLLSSVFKNDFRYVRDEFDDDSFYENGFSNKTVYMLSYIGHRGGGSKIYVISNPLTVANGELTLKIVASVGMLFFMLYWVLLALWAYQNAAKSKLYPIFWGIIVLFTNLAGVIVYLLYKHTNLLCYACGASQSRNHLFCTNCGTKLGKNCENCGSLITKKDAYCPNCGKKI